MPPAGEPGDAEVPGISLAGRVQQGPPAAPVVDVKDKAGAPGRSPDGHVAATAAAAPVFSSAEIADLLEVLAAANWALAVELEAISVSRASLSQATVNRLEQLVEQMRPAARVREVLAGLDPRVLLAGAREWHRRRPIDVGRPR